MAPVNLDFCKNVNPRHIISKRRRLGEVGLGIDAVQFGRFQRRIEECGVLAARLGTEEQEG